VFITEQHLDFINEIIVERDYFADRVKSKDMIISNLKKINASKDIIITLKSEQIRQLEGNVLDYKQVIVIEKKNTREQKRAKVKAYITGGIVGVLLGVFISFI